MDKYRHFYPRMFSLVSTESMDAETELLQVCVCAGSIHAATVYSLKNSHSHVLKEISGIYTKGSEVFLRGTWRDSLAS